MGADFKADGGQVFQPARVEGPRLVVDGNVECPLDPFGPQEVGQFEIGVVTVIPAGGYNPWIFRILHLIPMTAFRTLRGPRSLSQIKLRAGDGSVNSMFHYKLWTTSGHPAEPRRSLLFTGGLLGSALISHQRGFTPLQRIQSSDRWRGPSTPESPDDR